MADTATPIKPAPKRRTGKQPMLPAEVRDALSAGSADAAKYLIDLVNDSGAQTRDRVAAAQFILANTIKEPEKTTPELPMPEHMRAIAAKLGIKTG